MIKNMLWMLLIAGIGLMWYSTKHAQLATLLRDKKNQAMIQQTSAQLQEKIRNGKFTFAGREISINYHHASVKEYIKADPRAQRALFVFGLLMFNVWILPLIGGARQRRLKKELFDLNPRLLVENLRETRNYPYYSTKLTTRMFMSYPASFFATMSFVSPLATVVLVASMVAYAAFSYRGKTRKYESVENFEEAMAQGSGLIAVAKQMVVFFTPVEKKAIFDQAHDLNSERKAS